VLPLATSVDGRSFTFQASLYSLQLQVGSYATLAAFLARENTPTIDALKGSDDPEARRLGLRLANLSVDRYTVWARGQAGPRCFASARGSARRAALTCRRPGHPRGDVSVITRIPGGASRSGSRSPRPVAGRR
jgi:hypothetical protein